MRQKGFVFIELLTVVAIISVLVAVAIPAYTDYVQRSRISEGLSLALPIRVAVSQFYAQHGRLPQDNAETGIVAAEQLKGQYVSQIAVQQGTITIQFNHPQNLDGTTLHLEPQIQYAYPLGSIFWHCRGGKNMQAAYLPTSCKGGNR